MIEFGSDFHYIIPDSLIQNTINTVLPSAQYYADGRMALIALYHYQGWKRLWVPQYFCYEVLHTLTDAGIKLMFYLDYPGFDDTLSIDGIPFEEGDALLRVNYFGLRAFRSSRSFSVPVVEDHTHDLIGEWALNSDADWCVASLRKTLPIPEGGALWSPQGLEKPKEPIISQENQRMAETRWRAMKMKTRYLAGEPIEKTAFRNDLVETESYFDTSAISSIDTTTTMFLDQFDVNKWYGRKKSNWLELNSIKTFKYKVLVPESNECNVFSCTILCESESNRNNLRKALIEHQIYPAILWNTPEQVDHAVKAFSTRMLSVHCDGRYSRDDIQQLKSIIESLLEL